jgi:hypothetical protein
MAIAVDPTVTLKGVQSWILNMSKSYVIVENGKCVTIESVK